MKHPNTHNKRKRERQEEALRRREGNVEVYESLYLGTTVNRECLEKARCDVEVLRKKLNL